MGVALTSAVTRMGAGFFFFHFSASLFSFSLISVPVCIFPVRDFISHFSCPRFHFAFFTFSTLATARHRARAARSKCDGTSR